MILQNNRILEYVVGSNLYGTNTSDSDLDFSGVFIAPKQFYLGLSNVEQIDCSTISKRSDGKNNSDAIDFTMYEIRKFIKLALDNNPNVLEQLFVPKDKIIFADEFGQKLLKHAWMFPWKGLKQKFMGYAYSQRHKMMIKTDNYTGLIQFDAWLADNLTEPNYNYSGRGKDKILSSCLLAELRNTSISGIKFHEHHAQIGDLNISLTDKLSKVRNKVKLRLSKVGNREELYTKYGYDVKFGMHLIRLMLEGRELLLTGKLEYPLKEREMLLDVRNGKWSMEDIIKYSEQLEAEIESLEISSDLPNRPQYDKIEKLLIEMVEEYWSP